MVTATYKPTNLPTYAKIVIVVTVVTLVIWLTVVTVVKVVTMSSDSSDKQIVMEKICDRKNSE